MVLEDEGFEKLAASLEHGDWRAAFDAAHSLKGSLGNLALTPLYAPTAELTERLRDGREADYAALLTELLSQRDALTALRRDEKFDLIFVDPPYDAGLYGDVLETIKSVDKLTDGGVIICEARRDEPLPELDPPYGKRKEYRYGKVKIAVYTKESIT